MHRQGIENGDRDMVRYSAAYPTGAERMLRRETKTTVAIYCGNQVCPCSLPSPDHYAEGSDPF